MHQKGELKIEEDNSTINNVNTDNNNEPQKEDLNFNLLKEIDTASYERTVSSSWATSHGINEALKQYLSSIAHIFNPDAFSVESPISSDKDNSLEGAILYAKMINGFEASGERISNGIIDQDGGELKKPIVAIFNTSVAKAASGLDTNATGGLHWQTCVILPKNYKPKFGEALNNEYELIFYLDSLNSNIEFPQNLNLLLTKGLEYCFESEGTNYEHKISPAFPNAIIKDKIDTKQQVGGSDCGWWALYNALMIVYTGKVDFLRQFDRSSREPAYKLRSIFPHLEGFAKKPIKRFRPKKEELNEEEILAIKQAIKNSLEEMNTDIRLKPENIKSENYEDLTSDALKKTLHGNLYQLALLILAASRANREERRFYLITEAKELEKFDDLAIDYGDHITFLQAKHSAEGDSFNKTDFCANLKGDASLAKYFDSWMKLKNSKFTEDKSNLEKSSRYIFFTNKIIVNKDIFLEQIELENDEFLFEDFQTDTLRFKKDLKLRQEFIESILLYSKEVREKFPTPLINIEELAAHEKIEEAAKYLLKRFKEKRKKTESEVQINNKSKLDNQTLCLIGLAQAEGTENREIRNAIIAEIQKKINKKDFDQDEFKKWLIAVKIKQLDPHIVFANNKKAEECINEFLDRLVIKSKQPGGKSLEELIYKETRPDTNMGVNEFFNSLNKYMLDWFSSRHGSVLKWNEYDNFVNAEIADINRFYLLGDTRNYEQKYKNYFINLENFEIEDLYNFFVKDQKQHVALLYGEGGIEERIYQTTKKLRKKHGLKDAEWFYLTLDSQNLIELSEILAAHSTKFLVIDCRNQKEFSEEFITDLDRLSQSAQAKEDKRLILLVNSNQKEVFLQENHIEFPFEVVKAAEIEKICNEPTFKNNYIRLGGKHIPLSSIVNDKKSAGYQLMRNFSTFCSILKSIIPKDKVESTSTSQSGLPYNVYIENNLIKGIPVYGLKQILTEVSIGLFVIEGIDSKKLSSKLQNIFNDSDIKKRKYLVLDNEKSTKDSRYRLITNPTLLNGNYKEKLIFLSDKDREFQKSYIRLKVINEEKLKVVIDNVDEINSPMPHTTEYDFNNSHKEPFSRDTFRSDTSDGISVLSAKAGFGKSSFCLNEIYYGNNNPDKNAYDWNIRVNLPRIRFPNTEAELSDVLTQSTTGYEWSEWQLKLLKIDMQFGKVLFLLDGLDEIKDEKDVEKLNKWLGTLPGGSKVIVTTRPYAASKIILPKQLSLLHYLTFAEYTQDQHRKYIESYLKAIFDELKDLELAKGIEINPNDFSISSISNKICEKLHSRVNKNVMYSLGIPLESYIFCESLRPDLKRWLNSRDQEFNEDFQELTKFNIGKLYQHFIFTKLELFLQKHMEISVETTLKSSHRVYSLTASYNNILMIFAFKQAFSLSYNFISKHISRDYYTVEMIKELEDTGLVTVENQENEYLLKFNHETYQEYFAALFILKALSISDDLLYKIVKQTVLKEVYNPKYRIIIIMAAQLSLSGDLIIPGWNKDNNNQIKDFWKILCESGDVLGTAIGELFKGCLQGLLDEQLERLKTAIKDEVWASRLSNYIVNKGFSKRDIEHDDINSEKFETELPVNIQDDSKIQPVSPMSKEDRDKLKEELKIKEKVYEITRNHLQYLSELSELFEEIILDPPANGYWDIDGGFMSMALLGDKFNSYHAGYFIDRIKKDSSWRSDKALSAMSKLFRTNLKKSAKDACISVISCLISHRKHLGREAELTNLIKLSPTIILESFNDLLQKKLEQIDIFKEMSSRQTLKESFQEALIIYYNILWIARQLKYAMIVDCGYQTIRFIKDTTLELILEDNKTSIFFRKIQKLTISSLEIDDNEKTFSEIDDLDGSKLKDRILGNSQLGKEWKRLQISMLKDDPTNILKIIKEEKTGLPYLFKKLSKYKLINEQIIDALMQHVKTEGQEKNNCWSLHTGIGIVGYTGKYFTQELADFLVLRAKFWPDNKDQAISALKRIFNSLEALNTESPDEYYHNAVLAYNNCIENNYFKGEKLEKIHKKLSPNTEKPALESQSWVQRMDHNQLHSYNSLKRRRSTSF